MPHFYYRGYNVNIPSDTQYEAYAALHRSGFTHEHPSKAEVMKRLLSVSNQLPIGAEVKIEKIYHMTRGYEPDAKFRSGESAEEETLRLVEHGSFYDPRTGKPKKAKWERVSRFHREAGGRTPWVAFELAGGSFGNAVLEEAGGSRERVETYRGFTIRSWPTSHRGTRIYEAGIDDDRGDLADVAYGRTREQAHQQARAKVDAHLSGQQPLQNYTMEARGADTLAVFFDAPDLATEIIRHAERTLGRPGAGRWSRERFDQGWVLRYHPFDRRQYRQVEGALYSRFGNALRVTYETARERDEARPGLHEARGSKPPIQTPTLDRLQGDGVVWWETRFLRGQPAGGEWVGRAADGEIVSVGHDDEGAERYLRAHPSPNQW